MFGWRMLSAAFMLVLLGCQSQSAEIASTPACNGTAQEASPCLENKILSWRTTLGLPGHDSTYEVFEAACAVGDPDGCWMLGLALQGNSYLSKTMQEVQSFHQERLDPKRGASMIQKSCDLGSEYGCLNHAENLAVEANWDPQALQKPDLDRIMDDFYNSCELGFLTGCGGYFDLSVALQSAPNIEKEKYAAKELCNSKIGSGCHLLGVYIKQEAQDEDEHKLALPLWKVGCEYGHEDACRAYAGNMEYFGNDTEYNWAIRTACGHGFSTGDWGAVDSVDYPPCSSLGTASTD